MTGCANFRLLSIDLKKIDENSYRIGGLITNADAQSVKVRVGVVEWDRKANQILSADRLDLSAGGGFAFLVRNPANQYVFASADLNANGRWDLGEPTWAYTNETGQLAPVPITKDKPIAHLRGELSTITRLPDSLMDDGYRWLEGRKVEDLLTKLGICFVMGEVVSLDDPRFQAERGPDGLWTPASMAMKQGFGIYFLEKYDPARIPVLFIHGAGGTPQDWRYAMEKLDRKKYQPWFYFYPSGLRLDNLAETLNEGITLLHKRYPLKRLHVVAHSMGGLIARDFLAKNVIRDGCSYIDTFISVSSPFNGHEAAGMGVQWAPAIVPSWRDMEIGSEFLRGLFKDPLKGKVKHHIFYSHKATSSPVMPAENDGTVSLTSQLRAEAQADAASVQGYYEDHVSILKSSFALRRAAEILDEASRKEPNVSCSKK
jgi:pimeloyl-ACP methyl ester carboxylesterase